MNRNDFGAWGADLTGGEFAQALAALGVIWGERLERQILGNQNAISAKAAAEIILNLVERNRPLKWQIGVYRFSRNRRIKELEKLSAAELVRAWQIVVQSNGEVVGAEGNSPYLNSIRLEVYENERAGMTTKADVLWILEQLSKNEVRAASAYAFIPNEPTTVVWDFPLRVGLLNDAESGALRQEIENLEFSGAPIAELHVKFVSIEAGNSDCDVLLLPHDLRRAVARLIESPNALRADSVVVTGNIDETEARLIPLLESLRTQARAGGVCLVPVPASEKSNDLSRRQIWFKELIRQITHDQPIDIALFRASRDRAVNAVTPVFFAAPQLIKASRISRRLDKFSDRLAQPNLKNVVIGSYFGQPRDREEANYDYVSDRENSFGYMRNRMRESSDELSWNEESGAATTLSRMKTRAEAALETAPPPIPKSRWINTEIWETVAGQRRGESMLGKPALRPNAQYEIVIFIGRPNKNSISASEPFDDRMLPPGKNEHTLNIIFTEPQASPEPQTATIVLPRSGNSTVCRFYLRVPKEISEINARITVAYKNRVLQTALLKAVVAEPDREVSPDARIELLVESVIRPGLQDLTERQWFDAALILNHDLSGASQITRLVGDRAELVSIAELAPTILWFDDLISRVAREWKKFEKLRDPKTVELLRNCAIKGKSLYNGVMAGREKSALAAAERIQIVSAKYGARFPLEFVYGRRAPDADAPLCEHAEDALTSGRCGAACPVGKNESQTICPLGFWGLNRVIERHAYDAEALRKMPNADFALQTEPVEGRKRLNVLTKAIVAASENVDAVEVGSSQKVIDALDAATKKQSKSVGTWLEWAADVETRSPSLLVLLPHTLNDAATGEPTLEISRSERLISARLEKEYVLGPTDDPRPVVILMGCKTAAPDVAYESFILGFRQMGAALVVGTGSTILGRHAAPVTGELVKAISENASGTRAFGDVLLAVRRKMVAEGILMALTLTSYGDADWLI